MTRVALFLALLGSCVDSTPTPLETSCGPVPRAVGYVVAFQEVNGQRVAVLPVADFQALASEEAALQIWAQCATNNHQEMQP